MSARRIEHSNLEGVLLGNVPSVIAAAHELKSPLTLVRQLSLMLEENDLSDIERAQLLRQISLTSERALRLTNDLTKMSRLDDAMFELEPLNPHQLCEDIVNELTPLFSAHNRNVNLVSRRHALLLVANRDLLRRIVMNFTDNALNYSGGDKAVEIQVKALNKGETIRVGVRDYGPAISSDIWKKLQTKLAKAPQSVSARPQSSGLGLYIAGQFAGVMQGKIGVTKHRDGATFYIDLQASNQLSLL